MNEIKTTPPTEAMPLGCPPVSPEGGFSFGEGLLEGILQDLRKTPYVPEFKDITGSTTGAVLLMQIAYWHRRTGGEFYKFLEPCKHKAYRTGDSWQEELHFSPKEVRTALDSFAVKLGQSSRRKHQAEIDKWEADDPAIRPLRPPTFEERLASVPVVYYTAKDRRTFYRLQKDVLAKLLQAAFHSNTTNGQVSREVTNGGLPLRQEINTQTNTEITEQARNHLHGDSSPATPCSEPTDKPDHVGPASHAVRCDTRSKKPATSSPSIKLDNSITLKAVELITGLGGVMTHGQAGRQLKPLAHKDPAEVCAALERFVTEMVEWAEGKGIRKLAGVKLARFVESYGDWVSGPSMQVKPDVGVF